MRALEVVLVRPSNTTPWGLHCGILEGSTDLLVRRAVACSCAAKARPRLREGDRIVAVDGRPTAVVDDLEDVLPYFREAAGTCLRLAVERPRRGAAAAAAPPPAGGRWGARRRSKPAADDDGWLGSLSKAARSLSLMPAASRGDPAVAAAHAYAVGPRVVALRGGAALAALRRDGPLSALKPGFLEPLLGEASRALVVNVGEAATPRGALDACGGRAVALEFGWRAARGAHTPALDHCVRLGLAAGAWLALAADHRVVLCDAGGGHVRVGLCAAAVARVAPLVPGAALGDRLRTFDAAAEAYDAWLAAAGLETRLALPLLPPSFTRALGLLDAALACDGDAPNAAPLALAAAAVRFDELDLSPALVASIFGENGAATLDVGTAAASAARDLVLAGAPTDDGVLEATCDAGDVVLRDEFAVTLRSADGGKVARFASSAAFVGAGELSVPRASLDVFPDWRDVLPRSFQLRLSFARRPPPAAPRRLVPAAPDLLAVGLAALFGAGAALAPARPAAGAPDAATVDAVAARADVEPHVAAAALRASGGAPDDAVRFVDDCPRLLALPTDADPDVARWRGAAAAAQPALAPRRKPKRRPSLSPRPPP